MLKHMQTHKHMHTRLHTHTEAVAFASCVHDFPPEKDLTGSLILVWTSVLIWHLTSSYYKLTHSTFWCRTPLSLSLGGGVQLIVYTHTDTLPSLPQCDLVSKQTNDMLSFPLPHSFLICRSVDWHAVSRQLTLSIVAWRCSVPAGRWFPQGRLHYSRPLCLV